MTSRGGGRPGLFRLLLETATGRRRVERSGPLLRAFIALPAPLRDVMRWLLRPERRFLYGRVRALARGTVLSGPFVGTRLPGHPSAPELLGTYERELFPIVGELAARPFDLVANIGARFGYYAIGLARLIPAARVVAFESDREARDALASAVRANDVADRVQVCGYCHPADLAQVVGAGDATLVVCDIDGGEVALLDPALVPALLRATILVECHGSPESPTERDMTLRFLPSHDLRRVATEDRVLAHLPAQVAEPWRSRMPRTIEALMQEHRKQPQSWLLLTPRASATRRPSGD